MKTQNPLKRPHPFMAAIPLILMLLFLGSCATKAPFLSSPVVPAAEGSVSVKQDKNDNYVISVQIENLAPPQNLHPPKDVYVVWMESENQETKNIGQITSGSGLFSKRLKADFKTVSSVKPTKIFVTAERDPGTPEPDSDIILTTRRF